VAAIASPVSVVRVNEQGTKCPLFYMHPHWSGGAFYCFRIAEVLGPDQPLYVLDPYRFKDLDALPTFEEVAGSYREALQDVQLEGPYRLCGICGGALIAYEVAQQLQAQGQMVESLIMIDPQAGPGKLMLLLQRTMRRWSALIGRPLRWRSGKQLDIFLHAMHLVRLRHASYRSSSGVALWPSSTMLRHDWLGPFTWVAAGYKAQPYDGKISYLLPSEHKRYTRARWGRFAQAATLEFRDVPGTAWTCRNEYVQQLAETLRECLPAGADASADKMQP
jgi:thioesterase domain-containing protein